VGEDHLGWCGAVFTRMIWTSARAAFGLNARFQGLPMLFAGFGPARGGTIGVLFFGGDSLAGTSANVNVGHDFWLKNVHLLYQKNSLFIVGSAKLPHGELAEWSNATVLKTVRPSRVSRVRIPHSPPSHNFYTMKKLIYLLIAVPLLVLAGCQSEDFVSQAPYLYVDAESGFEIALPEGYEGF
jgi:hypothetical protein